MNSTDITIDFSELMASIEAATGSPKSAGFSVQEMSQSAGISTERARRIVGDGIRAGRLRPSRKQALAIDGVMRPVPCYIVVEEAKKPPEKAKKPR